MDDLFDTVVPIPDEDEVYEQIQADLESEGFPVSNYRNGTVFKTIIKIFVKIYVELINLARTILKNSFISTASGAWVDLKALDYSKTRKPAIKTQGKLTLSRTASGSKIQIPKNYIFYALDSNGNKLKYINLDTVIMNELDTQAVINVEAETPGTAYNVAANQITYSLIHIEGIDNITNGADWITVEGADEESTESLKKRIQNSWAELSSMPIRDKYKNAVEAVPGVLVADIDDQHPRGQGTIDIIVTSATGEATLTLLKSVEDAVAPIKGPYDNILIKSAVAVPTNINITIVIPQTSSDEGVQEQAKATISNYFASSRVSSGANELYCSELIFLLRNNIATAKSIRITAPSSDVILSKGQIVTLGTLSVKVERG